MPLTPLQFKMRITPETERWMRAAHEFLACHPDLAYSEPELLAELHGSHTDCKALATAMFELTYRGGVEARGEPGEMYYRYWNPIEEFEEADA